MTPKFTALQRRFSALLKGSNTSVAVHPTPVNKNEQSVDHIYERSDFGLILAKKNDSILPLAGQYGDNCSNRLFL